MALFGIGIAICLAVAVAYVVSLFYFRGLKRKGDPPRVWTWVPFVGSAIAFGKNPVGFIHRNRDRLGNAFMVTFQGHRTVFLADPRAYTSVFKQKDVLRLYDIAEDLVANAFLVPKHVLHLYSKQRVHDIMQEYLRTDSALHQLSDRIYRYLVVELQQVLAEPAFSGEQVNFAAFCERVFFPASYRMLMGSDAYRPEMLDGFRRFEKALPFLGAGMPLFKLDAKLRRGWLTVMCTCSV
jgi:hypothetical protein